MRPRCRGGVLFGKIRAHMRGPAFNEKFCIWGMRSENRYATSVGGPFYPPLFIIPHWGGFVKPRAAIFFRQNAQKKTNRLFKSGSLFILADVVVIFIPIARKIIAFIHGVFNSAFALFVIGAIPSVTRAIDFLSPQNTHSHLPKGLRVKSFP